LLDFATLARLVLCEIIGAGHLTGVMAASSSKRTHSERYGVRIFSQNGGKTWRGQMQVGTSNKNIGSHPTEDLAAHAYARCEPPED
jgi:hypothetical protein